MVQAACNDFNKRCIDTGRVCQPGFAVCIAFCRMDTHLRQASPDDSSSISLLVQASFVSDVASNWERSAQEEFLRETTSERLSGLIAAATFVAVYEEEGQILGVISFARPNLVQLLFVASGHLRRGIGRALWEAARAHIEERHPEVKTIELNSSPYAVSAYKALGFYPISEPFQRKGSVATRMACWLPGRTLARAQIAI